MKHSQHDIELTDDGSLRIGASAADAVRNTMEKISLELGVSVDSEWAAYVLLLTDDDKAANVATFDVYDWIWNRRHVLPKTAILPAEILDIRSTLRFPRLQVFTLWIKEDRSGITVYHSEDALPVLNSVVGRLQRILDLPVEWHHVLASLVSNFPHAPVVCTNQMWADSPHLIELVVRSLQKVVAADGRLTSLRYQNPDKKRRRRKR